MEFVFALINKVIKNTGLRSFKELKKLANNSEEWRYFRRML